ncbi:MAG: helix-turn-helix domain-containing protein [Cyanobacteria bacterium P01_F01_bin.53]
MESKQQGKLLSAKKIRALIRLQELGYSQSRIARECNVARSTVQDYLGRAHKIGLNYGEVENLCEPKLHDFLGKAQQRERKFLEEIDFQHVHRSLADGKSTLALIWQQGISIRKWKMSYGHFCRRYKQWSTEEDVNAYRTHLKHSDKKNLENRLWMNELLH